MPKGFFSSAHFQFGGNIEMQHNGEVRVRGRSGPDLTGNAVTDYDVAIGFSTSYAIVLQYCEIHSDEASNCIFFYLHIPPQSDHSLLETFRQTVSVVSFSTVDRFTDGIEFPGIP
jgi:hypothetical protein